MLHEMEGSKKREQRAIKQARQQALTALERESGR
jgi:hypothetical protein